MNKVVNVTLPGGIIGMLAESPQNSLNRAIKRENESGWRVVQIIQSASGNIFLAFFRLILLLITVFLYTTTNGYYVIMEKTDGNGTIDSSTIRGENNETTVFCEKCGAKQDNNSKFCEKCGIVL